MTCSSLLAAEDRAERRRKLGLPVEVSPEEEAAERAKQVEKEAAKRKGPVPAKPVTHVEKMREALVNMKKEAAGDDAKAKQPGKRSSSTSATLPRSAMERTQMRSTSSLEQYWIVA